jgi:VCBS repeat-containing protein
VAQNSTLYDVTGGGNGPSNVIEYTTVSGTISFGTPDAFYTYTGGSSSTTPIEFQAISLDAADGVYFVAAVVESNSNTSIYEEHFGATPSFTSAIATVTSTNYSVVENIGIDATDHTLFYADGVNVYSENFGSSFNNTPTVAKIAALPTPNATNDPSGGYASSMAYDQSEQAAYFGGATGHLTFTYTGPNHSGSKSYLIGEYYNNYIYKVSGVTKNATTAKTHVTTLVAVPLSDGVVTGMALDTANDTLVFVTQDGFTSGTNDVGVYSIALNNGGTPGAIKVIWQEATNSTSALGDSMDQITIDPVTGEYYISTNYGDSVSNYGANTIYEGNIASSAAPVAEYSTGSLTGSSGHAQPQGLAIDDAPTVSSVSVLSIDGNTGMTSGVIGVGDTLAIQVAFNENVTATGTPTLSLNDGGTASYVSGSGTAYLVFSYKPASGQNTAGLAVTGLTGTVTDSAGTAANTSGATATFSGIRVDTTPPSLSVTGTSVEALQGGSALNVLSANPGITDPDGTGTLTGAKLVIANPQAGDALAINGSSSGSLDGGALSYSFANDTLSLSGTAAEAQYQTALGEVTYQDTGTDTSTGAHPTRTLSFTVGEGTLTSSVATTVLTIDRSPSAIASVGASVAEGQQVTEGAGAALTGNSDLDGDALTITSVAQGATTLAAGNALTGTYGVLTLSANGGVTYNANDTAAINAAADGAPPVDSFNFTISDGHGGMATETFDVTVNRPAVLSGATPPTTYTANDAPATVDSALTVADPDGTNLTGAQVAIGAGFLAGDVLTFTSTGGIGGNYNAATGVLTLSGSEAAADYQSALDSVQFYSTSADPTDGGTDDSRVINTTSEGPGGTSNAQPATVEVALCYLRGTRILTPTGEASIEDFKIGDHVVTRFSGIQPVKRIGRQSFAPEDRANWPIRIHAGALADGFPARDLFVSPGHSILLEGRLVLADLLVNGITIAREPPARRVDYYMLELGAHDCVIAEGAWAETYADAPGQRAQFINAAEYEALYPDEPPVQNLRLCAARPEGGKALNEVLRGVTARAGAGLAHGPLEGYVERVIEDWRITGWAFSLRHPQLPVLLEIHAAGRLLGSVLACDPRKDLAAAGKGSGRCAFTFQSPVRLKPEMLATLSLRRAADGEALPIDPQLQARPAAAARRLTLAG